MHVSHYEADAFARWARRPAADRVRVGARGRVRRSAVRDARPRPTPRRTARSLHPRRRAGSPGLRAGVRRRVAVDRERVPALPALRTGAGRGRRVQRQVHERPDGAARRRVHHARRPRPHDVPQLLPARRAVGCSRACASRPTRNDHQHAGTRRCRRPAHSTPRVDVHLTADDLRAALRPTPTAASRSTPKDIPPKWFYDDRGSQLFDDITRLPEYYPTRCERAILVEHAAEIADGHQRRHARRARLGHLGEDAHPARRAARRGHDHALRARST